MPNTRRSNIRRTRRRNTRRSNNRRVRRNTRRSRRVRSNTRRRNNRRNKRGKGDVPIDMLVDDLGDFDTNDMLAQLEALEAEKRLAWMTITKTVMGKEDAEQQTLIRDIAEMVGLKLQ